jgi:RimJ/RimL family protein N-acetyltransferase
MARIKLKKAEKEREYLLIADLAHEIWREHYVPILGADQIEYMLEKFQSAQAIQAAVLGQGYEYYLIKKSVTPIGYVGIQPNHPAGKLFLSKFYLLKKYRGNGYAHDVVEELAEMGRQMRLGSIWLTVSKQNLSSIEAYTHLGFAQTDVVCTDIGGGFVMDDYIFEKTI